MRDFTLGKIEYLLKLDFIRYCIVGGLGFIINISLLTLFRKGLGLPLFFSQLMGAEIALFSNFMLHQHWTYKKNKVEKSLRTLLVQFHLTSWPAIIGSSIMVTIGVSTLHFNSEVALVISSLIVLGWNYFWSKYVVWKNINNEDIMDIAK